MPSDVPSDVLVAPDADRVVCVGEGQAWSAQQLATDVHALAGTLPARDGDEVLVLCEGRYAFAVSLLACWSVGAVVRLPPDQASATLQQLADACAACLHDGAQEGIDVRSYLGSSGPALPIASPADDAPVVVLSTSGSTGEVRSVPKTARQLLGEARVLAACFEVGSATVVATVPPRHIYGLLFSLLVPLRSGGAFVDETPFFGEAVAARIARSSATVLVTVPAHLRALTASKIEGLGALSRVFSSGAPLGRSTASALHLQHELAATEVFGSTETGGIAWRHQLQDAAWTPLPDVDVSVDEDERMWVDSDFLPPEGPRPWPSDDRIALRDDGRFEHRGRRDDVVKIASRRVSVGSVQRKLQGLAGVEDVVVLPVSLGERTVLKALLVAPDLSAEDIRTALSDALEGPAMPRLVFTDALPRTSHGKLPRHAVLSHLAAAEAPADGLERRSWRVEGHQALARFVVKPNAKWFEGHFPGHPVLPGVAQLISLVARPARRAWPALQDVSAVPRVRFLEPVGPHDVLDVTLTRAGARVTFLISRTHTPVAKGTIAFRQHGGEGSA